MNDGEIIDRLCSVNAVLLEIVREQQQIIKQHGIEVIGGRLPGLLLEAETETGNLDKERRCYT